MTAATPPQPSQPASLAAVRRYEAKYIVPPALVSPIRAYIKPFCAPDAHGAGDPPEYRVTTLQLDSPALSLHRAKEQDALNRFKLRVRHYGGDTVFAEVKRKLGRAVVKTRAALPAAAWGRHLFAVDAAHPPFASDRDVAAFVEFARLLRLVGAEPAVLIRYVRESYFSRADRYARVSLDRDIRYQAARS